MICSDLEVRDYINALQRLADDDDDDLEFVVELGYNPSRIREQAVHDAQQRLNEIIVFVRNEIGNDVASTQIDDPRDWLRYGVDYDRIERWQLGGRYLYAGIHCDEAQASVFVGSIRKNAVSFRDG